MVKTHNDYRAKHNTPPLVGDSNLQKIARELAQKFADLDQQLVNQRRETQNLEHSKPDHLGHNVAIYSNPISKFDDCDSKLNYWIILLSLHYIILIPPFLGFAREHAKIWYNENEKHEYTAEGSVDKTGHFTQMVWKNTTKIGCGLAISRTYTLFGVCNYSPEGNTGDFTLNVIDNTREL